MGVILMLENRLHKLEDYVKPVLENFPTTRNDDFELITKVYDKWLGYSNYTKTMSFKELLSNHIALDLPPFESITRCRRKLQMMYPHLRPTDDTGMIRANETATYIEYALDL